MSHADVIREWIKTHRMAFALREEGDGAQTRATFLEVPTGKTLTVLWSEVSEVTTDRDSVRGGSYLRITLLDGRHFVLSGMGFVFAPSFLATGPLEECPPTACFLDFEKLYKHLVHLVDDTHEGHDREALQTLMILLSFLEGARLMGLDVSSEERKLEKQLKRLEERGIA